MEELVARGFVRANKEAENWKEAIMLAGQLLIDSGDIEKSYIDDMIASVENYGPYMVIAKGFALAHAAPCPAVKNNAISLINLKQGVEFGSHNDPVKVVMCLACLDKESHMEKLQKIAMILMQQGKIEALSECRSDEALYKEINGE